MKVKINDVIVKSERRKIDDKKVESLADSIKEIGLINPITITKKNVLIAGAHRLEAVKILGWNEVEVNYIKSDNNLHIELAEIDENLIRNELHWIEQDEAIKRRKIIYELLHPETKSKVAGGKARHKSATDIMSAAKTFTDDTSEKTGKTSRTIRRSVQRGENIIPEIKEDIRKLDVSKTEGTLLSRLNKEDQIKIINKKKNNPNISIEKSISEVKKEENKKIRQQREIDEIKKPDATKAKVIHGDCLAVIDNIPDIDLLITDPPYFTDGDFTTHIARYLLKVKPTGQAYVFASGDPKEVQAYLNMKTPTMELSQILVWNYNNTGQRQPNVRYTSNYQLCFYYRGINAPNINKPADGKEQYSCQTINAPDGRIGDRYFKWQKPMELIERLIRNSSVEGDIVVDPFVGVGTTVLAAAKHGRNNIGIELDDANIKICIERGCINVD